MNNTENKPRVEDKTINGVCTCCGECCTNVLLATENEIANVKKYIKKHDIKPVIYNNILFKKSSESSNICPFLNKDNQCNIYKVRFSLCRHFDCSKQRVVDDELPYHLGIKAIDALGTFFPEEFNPAPPNLRVLNASLERRKNG